MRRFNATVAATAAGSLRRAPVAAASASSSLSVVSSAASPLCLSSSSSVSNVASTSLCSQGRAFRIVTLGVDTPEEVAARKAAEAAEKHTLNTVRGGKYLPAPDPLLTSFPDGVGSCTVFRNVLSSAEEQLIWEELMPVMKQEGTLHFAEATKVDEKRLRNIYLELYGMKPYTDINNWKKQETKQVPGFVWTPTFVKWLRKVGPEIEAFINKMDGVRLTPMPTAVAGGLLGGLGGDGAGSSSSSLFSTGGKQGTPILSPQLKDTAPNPSAKGPQPPTVVEGPVHWLDMGRIVEHNDPGYEMHTEHPTTGRYFIYVNLLSETVLTFDDEATGRVGHVLLPQRSLMVCSSELRWGWRVGEHSSRTQTYEKATTVVDADGSVRPSVFRRTVAPDIRLSLQLWKYDAKLADRRHLQSQIESSVRAALGGDGAGTSYDGEEGGSNGSGSGTSGGAFKIDAFALDGGADKANKPQEIKRGTSPLDMTKATAPNINDANNSIGLGKLGGDLVSQADRDAVARSASVTAAAAASSGDSSSTAVAAPKTMQQVDKDFSKYKDSFARLTGVMADIKTREDAGMKVSDEWLKEKMNFDKEGDEYGFDPANPERTWEQIENKARFYRDRIQGMDYDGTSPVGVAKGAKNKAAGANKKGPSAASSSSEPTEEQKAARASFDAELVIEGLEEEDAVAAQKRRDDDEEGDGMVGDRYSGFGNPNRSPADMRAMMEKLMPREKADRMIGSLPKSMGGGMQQPQQGTPGSGPFGGSGGMGGLGGFGK